MFRKTFGVIFLLLLTHLPLFAQDDIIATLDHTNGLEIEVQAFESYPSAGNYEPANGLYVVMLAQLDNTSRRQQCVYARDVRLIYNGREYAPERAVMAALQRQIVRDYIGPLSGHCVRGGETELTYAAFDVPANISDFTIRYGNDEVEFDADVIVDISGSLEIRGAAQDIMNSLAIVAGGRNIERVEVADGRDKGGERVVLVSYLTTESTEAGYVEEWIDIFSGVAASISINDLDVDSVALVVGEATGEVAGVLAVGVDDLMAFYEGRITRSQFLNRLSSTVL